MFLFNQKTFQNYSAYGIAAVCPPRYCLFFRQPWFILLFQYGSVLFHKHCTQQQTRLVVKLPAFRFFHSFAAFYPHFMCI